MLFVQIGITLIMIFSNINFCLASQRIIESQIGPFNLANTPMRESQLISEYGIGDVKTEKIDDKILGKRYIYYVTGQQIWIEIHLSHVLDENLERVVEAILVTKKKLCDEKFKPKKPFGLLITSMGIKIGDSIKKVINTYGEPSEKYVNVVGQALKYMSDDPRNLLFTEFSFDEVGLHSMLISISE